MIQKLCYDFPLPRSGGYWMAQVVLPRDMTSSEAERLCAFIMTLAMPDKSPPQEQR